MTNYDILIIGGGASGFFTAINIAERNSAITIAILERGEILSKVRVSGGGRCNVTNACDDRKELVKFYPRGEKELQSAFSQFSTTDTIAWFKEHQVFLNAEMDGRLFPVTNTSQTIIDCFVQTAKRNRISILTGNIVQSILKENEQWKVQTQREPFTCTHLVMASGSNVKMWEALHLLGHTIIKPVPSLFAFNIKNKLLNSLSGIATKVSIKIQDTKLQSTGSLLITHFGISGPAVLKLSSFGARVLHEMNYHFVIVINWIDDISFEEVEKVLQKTKITNTKKAIATFSPFNIPNRLWQYIILQAGITSNCKWVDISKNNIQILAKTLTSSMYQINGKSTNKDEFVTAGGVELKEINIKTMESKLHKDLYFVGEVLNIDAVTGGFNFQNAWTTGYIAAKSICDKYNF